MMSSPILIKNIYYMLAYAFQSLNVRDEERIASEDFEHVSDLFAALLSQGIARQLKQGLYREYLDQTRNLSSVRGKIELTGTIREQMRRRREITCTFDELSENNLFNQIVKTTALLLERCPEVKKTYRQKLRRELAYFSNVDMIDPKVIRWSDLRLNRSNRSYRMLLGICRLVIEGMLMTTEKGEMRLNTFVDDQRMSRLYEKFLLEYYRREHPELKVSASRIPWALDNGGDALLPIMQSDIMLESPGKDTVLIIDAKYYGKTLSENRFGGQTIHSANLYQIFTYVKNQEASMKDPHTVSGMILYAGTDETVQPDQSYSMSENRIDVKTLDLNRDFSEIRRSLDGIVSDHFAASGPRAPEAI